MADQAISSPDDIRAMFASALSEMYRREVPQYGALLELVSEINHRDGRGLEGDAQQRIEVERHGAIRLGTVGELTTIRRLFSVMGMQPVGYYDLASAGLPVHATCFRPVSRESLSRNPFRVFTSLLRLELIQDQPLRSQATEILARRDIFTPRCLELIEKLDFCQSCSTETAQEFVKEALEIFRWHKTTTVDVQTYKALKAAHPLVADVVCFKGPHINHLTPRVVDIEAAQINMKSHGLQAKEKIEGPPPRLYPILLRQTSFLALEEEIAFSDGVEAGGKHKARFGEIEQRGMALTPKGRHLYDDLISRSRQIVTQDSPELEFATKQDIVAECFKEFPDDLQTLRQLGLAYFTYSLGEGVTNAPVDPSDIDKLIDMGILKFEPITYEDFLPVSAAGIFHSNLGANGGTSHSMTADQSSFEKALGCPIRNEFELYRAMQEESLSSCLMRLMAS